MKNITQNCIAVSLRSLLLLCLIVSSFTPLYSQNTTIEWDIATRKFVTSGVYARVKKIRTGELVMVYSAGPDVHIRKSNNNGASWSNPILVAHSAGYNNTNSEVTQLANGWLIYSWNGRPLTEGNLPFTIKTKISRDNGNTWGDERTPYTGGATFANGVWEPVTLQLPSGEVQLYFANESPYRNSNEQEITIMRSLDNGLTWGNATAISFRAGARDGMPVPVNLKNNKGIAVVIEDNGINGTFKPVIVWSSTSDNWYQPAIAGSSPNRWHALRTDYQLPSSVYAGAPYLVQLPSGETLLSVQSTEGRASNADNISIMQVYVGDDNARNFANRSVPFTNIPANGNAMWNSLAVIDDNTVMAVSSINGAGTNGIWTVIGRVVRRSPVISGRVYRLISRNSSQVLDVNACSSANGANVQQWPWIGGNCQRWKIELTNNGYYRLTSVQSNQVLDVNGCSTTSGANVQQWPWLGGWCQQWKIEPTDNGFFRLIARHSGKALDVNACSMANGANVQQWPWNGAWCQQWKIEEVGVAQRLIIKADALESEKAELYPNPVGNSLSINWGELDGDDIKISLLNSHGIVLNTYNSTSLNQKSINTSHLKDGVYYLVLQGKEGVLKKKFIIKK